MITSVMIRHQFFHRSCFRTTSQSGIQEMAIELTPCLNLDGWIADKHGLLLQRELETKIAFIRDEMRRTGELDKLLCRHETRPCWALAGPTEVEDCSEAE